MTKIKLADGTILKASNVELERGILKITTTDLTTEKLAKLFSNKSNTSVITLMTESEVETGTKEGFTSFAGINYGPDGTKTVELFQPVDTTEARIASAEAAAKTAADQAAELTAQNELMAATIDTILIDIIPNLQSVLDTTEGV